MLVVKYQRRIERLIGRMVRDVDLVPDIAQETFIRAYRALPQFRGDSAFYTWLYRIAVNTAKKALVDLKRDPLISEAAFTSGEDGDETSRVQTELSDGETPEAVMASKEVAATVNAAIEALSEDLRQAITLRESRSADHNGWGACLHDGREFPSDDVKWNLLRVRDQSVAGVAGFFATQSKWFTAIDTPDKHTVVLTSDQPRVGAFDFFFAFAALRASDLAFAFSFSITCSGACTTT